MQLRLSVLPRLRCTGHRIAEPFVVPGPGLLSHPRKPPFLTGQLYNCGSPEGASRLAPLQGPHNTPDREDRGLAADSMTSDENRPQFSKSRCCCNRTDQSQDNSAGAGVVVLKASLLSNVAELGPSSAHSTTINKPLIAPHGARQTTVHSQAKHDALSWFWGGLLLN